MRKVLLISALFIGMVACTARDDTSTADTVELRPAPAQLDTARDTVKVDTTALLNEDINGYDHAGNDTKLRALETDLRVARDLDSRDLRILNQVHNELVEICVSTYRQSKSDCEAIDRAAYLESAYGFIQFLQSDNNGSTESDGIERSRYSSTNLRVTRNDPAQWRENQSAAYRSAKLFVTRIT